MDASVRPFPESRLCSPFGRSARQTSGRYHRSHSKMTGRTIRLAIQSSRRLMREALGTYLASGPGFAVVGQTASLESLITLCALRRPEVALVEIDSLTGEAVEAPTHDPSRLPSLAVGEAPLVVVRGPDGPCRDQVVLALVACGQPFALAETAPMTGDKDWPRWQRDALVNVLIDPTPEDWALASTLGGPVLLVLSKRPDLAGLVDALLRGAHGLVHSEDVRDDLCSVLSLVGRGFFAFNAVDIGDLADWLSDGLADNGVGLPDPGPPELTARERDILTSIANGHTIRQTARLLGIACKTVENTQARLFRKLGAHNRSGALRTAYRLGLVDPGASGANPPSGEPNRPARLA